MKLAFSIAKTHLLSRPKQTIVAMMGVTFGIGMFIAMVSLMTGLNDMTEDLAMTSSPDIRIYHDNTQERPSIVEEVNPNGVNLVHHTKPKNESLKVRNAFKIADIIRQHKEVRGVSPQLISQVFYNYGPVQLNGTISGVDILAEDNLFDIRDKMKEGKIENLIVNQDGIIMGTGLAKKLNAHTGDRVVITTPQGFTMSLKIVGLFQMGMGAIDNVKSYANISTVQNILQKDKSFITDINIKLYDFNDAKQIAPQFQKTFGYKSEDWETANATMLLGVIIRNILTYSVSITLLIVAGFGIYNILNMTIMNKMKDIAILKAMGFAGKDVKQIFMIQSLVIGFFGSILGLGIGFCLSYLISLAPFNGGDIISIDHLPVNFKPVYYIIGIVFGVATTAIAGYMPSRKAARIDPIEILRGV
jgi:lipoprotein-releasing system permease protein